MRGPIWWCICSEINSTHKRNHLINQNKYLISPLQFPFIENIFQIQFNAKPRLAFCSPFSPANRWRTRLGELRGQAPILWSRHFFKSSANLKCCLRSKAHLLHQVKLSGILMPWHDLLKTDWTTKIWPWIQNRSSGDGPRDKVVSRTRSNELNFTT